MKPPFTLRATTVSFTQDPRTAPIDQAMVTNSDGLIAVGASGRIDWVGAYGHQPSHYKDLPHYDASGMIAMPGFIDAHVHFPQFRMLAAPAEHLLEWLKNFAFPEELRYADEEVAKQTAGQFLDLLQHHGTTSALVFATSHTHSAHALLAEAERRQMAIATSKTIMDRMAPSGLCDTPDQAFHDTEQLIERWHHRGRSQIAITLRFAITASEAALEVTGALVNKHRDCLFQTHLAESPEELATVARQFPWARDYSAVYERFDLLGPKSIFAHAIYLNEREQAVLASHQARLVHCPSSNNFLGSGMFNLARFYDPKARVQIGLATDIAGGTSYSMLAMMAEAYKIARLQNIAFSVWDGFYLATLGNARLLHLDQEIGALKPGYWADLVLLDPRATPVLQLRNSLACDLEAQLFALMMLGDDRAIKASCIAGQFKERN
ncbi:MAG: guanine deaminase [Pseudomonadota bacterium]